MPRVTRTPEEVDAFRQEILEAALRLIVEHGFEELSMRKIAASLGRTATTIYNYFSGKDELYFYIRIRGFEILHDALERALLSREYSRDAINAVTEEYLRFGREYPDYYEVMFLSRSVPKFLDCVGTPLEDTARREKETALRPFLLIAHAISEQLGLADDEARYLTIRLWTELNGIVSLVNSRLLREVEEEVDGLVERLAADICGRLGDEV